MNFDTSFFTLIGILIALLSVVVFIGSFRLPPGHAEREKQREEIRKFVLRQEEEKKGSDIPKQE